MLECILGVYIVGPWDPGSNKRANTRSLEANTLILLGNSVEAPNGRCWAQSTFLSLGECGLAFDGQILSSNPCPTTTRSLTLSKSFKLADTQLTCRMGSGWDGEHPPGHL